MSTNTVQGHDLCKYIHQLTSWNALKISAIFVVVLLSSSIDLSPECNLLGLARPTVALHGWVITSIIPLSCDRGISFLLLEQWVFPLDWQHDTAADVPMKRERQKRFNNVLRQPLSFVWVSYFTSCQVTQMRRELLGLCLSMWWKQLRMVNLVKTQT